MLRQTLALLLFSTSVPAVAQSAPAATTEQPSRVFAGSDLFGLEMADSPQISPDGTRVAYVRKAGDVMADKMRSAIWLVDAKTGEQVPLAGSGSQFSPVWSTDGKRLAYVGMEEGGSPQLYVRWMEGGATARITGLPDSPSSLAWSPDGKLIAYVMHLPGEATKFGEAPAKPEGAKWAEPLEVIDRVTYRADGGGYIKPGYDQVFVVAADGGAPRQLTFGKFDVSGPLSFAPDGKTLVLSSNRRGDWEREPNDSEVFALDVASGALTQLTRRYGPDHGAVVSPDGSRIAYLGYDDTHLSYQPDVLYVMDRDGSNGRALTAGLDRSIEDVQWSADGRSIYVAYDDKAVRKVARVDLAGKLTVLAEGLAGGGIDRPYTGGNFSVSKSGVIAWTGDASGGARPANLFVGKRQVTQLNETQLSAKTLGKVEPFDVTASDGRKIGAWLVLPPGYQAGKRVPLILEIHGGPHSAYGQVFSTDDQLYAAHGYAVLFTNPRGSTSYGSDFANLIDKNYPSDDYGDLMSAVDAAIAKGVADPDNLFVTGGSGGGVLTSWIVGKTDRFKAAAAQKPVINWISEALTMDGTGFTSRYWFKKQPWEDPMSYWNRSPLSLVGNVKTPTMVVVGSEDFRTPVSESEQYYAALQIRGVPTALVKVPGASHGGFTARPSQSAAKASAILAWFDKYRTDAGKTK
ncbi:prolyl oligopeptidase family serine peptidase [Novosphingobium sp.]|uniref:prolyl oligopeptidase family serine peptidase n=1 Tax=Novosphingobium sp. TaxID=1874826 RepID=UPI003BA8879A